MTDRLCATCGEPHPWTRERGFYGADGHAFKVVSGDTHESTHATHAKGGWRSSFFGALVSCERCGMVADPKHKDLVKAHEESHG